MAERLGGRLELAARHRPGRAAARRHRNVNLHRVNLLYVISAYKLPEQLVRLVTTLRGAGATFFVHVDRRSPREVHERVARGLTGLDDVHVLEPHDSPYSGFGHVRTTLKGIAAAERLGVPFEYAILLSGQDYPIKPAAERIARLRSAGGASFIDHSPLPRDSWRNGGLDRLEYWHFDVAGRRRRFPNRFAPLPIRRRMPDHIRPWGGRPWGGSSYWCLSSCSVKLVQNFVRANPRYVRFFHRVDVPDELFFQTILANSPLREELIDDDLRYIVWEPSGVALLGPDRIDELADSNDIFARKFDTQRDPSVLDLIDRELLGVA